MRSLELTVPDETAESLEVEAELLGHDDLSGYLAWLVGHRFAVDDGTDRSRVLTEFAEQMQDVDETDERALSEAAQLAREAAGRPVIDGDTERVDRVTDETLRDEAKALRTVEEAAVDEFARSGAAQTRKRLGSGFGSGIDYDSRTDISCGKQPGADIADLSEIEVPGWDDELVRKRQAAVGAALAFLRNTEEAKRAEFVDELYDQYPAGYSSAGSWWECIKQGLRQVDRVSPAHENSRTWEFRTTPGRVTRISYV